MPTSEPAPVRIWDIVRVPFPYTDRPVRQRRPALVVAYAGNDSSLLWVLMITSAENRGWHGDVAIPNQARTGLPVPSLVRTAKIATIEAADAETIGALPAPARRAVTVALHEMLAGVLT